MFPRKMGTKQIWKDVDIQISSVTNLSQWKQASLLKVSVWQVHLGHLFAVSILCSAQTEAWKSSGSGRPRGGDLIPALQMNFNQRGFISLLSESRPNWRSTLKTRTDKERNLTFAQNSNWHSSRFKSKSLWKQKQCIKIMQNKKGSKCIALPFSGIY